MKAQAKLMLRKLFELGQRLGVDVLPRHFYSEIPDIRRLKQSRRWRRPYSLQGIAGADPDAQLEFVRQTLTPEIRQWLHDGSIHDAACRENGAAGFGKIEAEFLYAYVSRWQPAQIVQVGAGVSTAVCLAAARDAGYSPRLTCVDPFPTGYLKALADRGAIELIDQPVQELPETFAAGLGAGDLFFIDSTHTLGPAGEVSWLILEVLPRLGAGVRVHFHDIVFPYDYYNRILTEALFFAHESVLLQAFLAYNSQWRVAASLSLLHHRRQAELGQLFEHYRPMKMDDGLCVEMGDFPSSTYLERVAAPT